jgi:hypothetical protein
MRIPAVSQKPGGLRFLGHVATNQPMAVPPGAADTPEPPHHGLSARKANHVPPACATQRPQATCAPRTTENARPCCKWPEASGSWVELRGKAPGSSDKGQVTCKKVQRPVLPNDHKPLALRAPTQTFGHVASGRRPVVPRLSSVADGQGPFPPAAAFNPEPNGYPLSIWYTRSDLYIGSAPWSGAGGGHILFA